MPKEIARPIASREPLAAIGTTEPAVRLSPIARETIQDRVYSELRRALIYGLFDPGQVLVIADLAASLATSTMPVREAVSRLVSEQALEALPNRSVRVPLIDERRIEDLLRARILIEGAALEQAVPRITPEQIDALRPLVGDYSRAMLMRDRVELETELELNKTFHFQVYQASGSAVLLPIIESLWLQSGPCVRAAVLRFDPFSELSALHYHGEILAALEARDVEAARRALVSDISRAFDLLRDRPLDEAENEVPRKRRYRRRTP